MISQIIINFHISYFSYLGGGSYFNNHLQMSAASRKSACNFSFVSKLFLFLKRFIFFFFTSDVILQELVSLFMQELWMERPSPDQFLSFLLSYTDCGFPVVDSLVLALGGTKVIASWTQNQNM